MIVPDWPHLNRGPQGAGAQMPRRGRPDIGGYIDLRLGDELKARVDAWAAEQGVKRPEAIRRLLTMALDREDQAKRPGADGGAAGQR